MNKGQWTTIPPNNVIDTTLAALQKNGIDASFVETGGEAKKKVFEMMPGGAEVMTMTSVTLDTLGIPQYIAESGKYNVVREKLNDENISPLKKQKLGAGPEWALGSVHAVTQQGQLVIASNSGSQLPAYAYGATQVVWIVSAHKIVDTLDNGIKRIYDYVLPLESERAHKAYGVAGSNVSKLLIINRENIENRLHLIFVNEHLGF